MQNNRWLWATAILSSIVLISFVVSLVDWRQAVSVLSGANQRLLLFGVSLLALEGFITAQRCLLLSIGPACYSQCLRATAWYVLLLLALPARLGEVAGVGTLVRYVNQHAGEAAVNLLLQRIFDVLVLGTLLGVAGVLSVSGEQRVFALAGSTLLVGSLIFAVINLADLISLAARFLCNWRQRVWVRHLLRFIFQARRSVKRHVNLAVAGKLMTLTVVKWLIILVGITCVVLSVVPVLDLASAFGVGVAYNLAALVPLQTIGGAGITEIVLLGSFKWLGYTAVTGATLAITIRLALLIGPILFGVVLLLYFEFLGANKQMVGVNERT